MQRTLYIFCVIVQTVAYFAWTGLNVLTATDPWLLPAFLIGGALFLAIPSIVLFIWGRHLYELAPSRLLYWMKWISLIPLIVSAVGITLTIVVFLIAPSGVGNS